MFLLGLQRSRTINAAMALFNLTEFSARLLPGVRLIGLDPGARRIGVALSDVGRQVASPYGVILRGRLKDNAAEIAGMAEREGAGGLVIGLPIDELGRSAQGARDWAHALSAATGLPGALMDESFSTADAHERMIEAGVSRIRRAELVDKVAAAAILQSALDAMRGV
jgi:putative Holliday junction resolvase